MTIAVVIIYPLLFKVQDVFIASSLTLLNYQQFVKIFKKW